MNSDIFFEKYKPVYNHLRYTQYTKGQTEGDEYGSPMYFETYGEDLEYVRSHDPKYIWTYIAGDDFDEIVQGYHRVNRMAYFIASVPYDGGPDTFSYQ